MRAGIHGREATARSPRIDGGGELKWGMVVATWRWGTALHCTLLQRYAHRDGPIKFVTAINPGLRAAATKSPPGAGVMARPGLVVGAVIDQCQSRRDFVAVQPP